MPGLVAAVYVFTAVMMGTTIPTPLYPTYEAHFGFGSAATTVLFAVYAGGVILALVVVGRLSDTIGRRPALLVGIVLSLLSAGLFTVGTPEWLLYAGRVLSGFSAGIFTSTATVAVLEAAPRGREKLAGALATAGNIGGLGLGMLMAGVVATVTPWPLRAPYVVHAGLLVIAGVALLAMRETAGERTPFRLQPPRVPSETRSVFGAAAIGAVTGFAVCGLFSSIAPNFVGTVIGVHSPAVVGTVTFLLFGASAAAQVSLRPLSNRALVLVGTVGLVVGMAVLVVALLAASLPTLIASAVLAGAGQGLLFMAGLRTVTGATAAADRTATTTTYFVVAYLAIAVPAVAAGLLSHAVGLTATGVVFAAAVVVGTLLGLFRLRSFDAVAR
ncbi:MFS transporter [Curtobacterium sp. MCBD17_040]|uniref:MFS transporter n=1 Tax=Curtobacterium sp. MCBD17_040 TaxID=2175674 RepID=UPI001C647655|nr:MFS transporter [Curtobacterium sp. MCBD17_040]WIB62747.1 MFS transporter [Curtobacterium sp. MCBD17_040]